LNIVRNDNPQNIRKNRKIEGEKASSKLVANKEPGATQKVATSSTPKTAFTKKIQRKCHTIQIKKLR